jgi:aspartyl-tRNA(Asn)/glutamyl-tRNA(Gln) amidotransferase subunit C
VPTISRDEVAHLARLARLAVTEEELDLFASQLEVILTSVARVGAYATEDGRFRVPRILDES